MRRVGVAIKLAAVLAALGGPAAAETKFFAYSGKSSTFDAPLTILQPGRDTRLTFHDVQYDDESFRSPLFYGFRVTHFPKRSAHLGFGIEFIHFKMYADTSRRLRVTGIENGVPVDRLQRMDATVQRFSISHGVNLLTANVVGRLELLKSPGFPEGRLQPYAAFGVGPMLLHPESEIGGRSRQQYEWDALVPQLTAGLDYQVSPRVSLFAEAKLTTGTVDVDVVGGRARTGTTSYHVVVGTAYTFR